MRLLHSPPLLLAGAPLLLRGPPTGLAELVEYYHVFLAGHQHGEIDSYTAGQNIAALVSRMMRGDAYRYLPASESVAQRTYQVLWGIVLLTFLSTLALLRRRRAPVSAFELSLVFLTALLLSPITFTTHLVSLLFVYATFLSVPRTGLTFAARAGLVLAVGAMAIIRLLRRPCCLIFSRKASQHSVSSGTTPQRSSPGAPVSPLSGRIYRMRPRVALILVGTLQSLC